MVVHDDLNAENMLFQNHGLVSILDFGDAYIGLPEQEFRQLYRINDLILTAAAKKYEELSGKRLNIEASRAWAIVQELAVYAELLVKKDTEHPSFLRAAQNLTKWLPEGAWGIPSKTSRVSKQ